MSFTRTWHAEPAVRSHTPLLVGIMGPSGGGKTMSALRLAKGIQQVVGGDIFGVDTESRRMLHYADYFQFKHVDFKAPFSSEAYEDCLKWCVAQGAKTVIVDSMSHEHAGENGYIEFHEAELDRLAGVNASQADRDKRNMQAWIKPSAARQKLIRTMLQLDANFVFTFRARERVKPTGGGKVQEMGFMPEAGDAFLYEMTVCCLLMPVANGVPTWQSAMPGEAQMIKPARQFADLFDGYGLGKKPLSESHGEGLALWARGKALSGDGGSTATNGNASPASTLPADWDHLAWADKFASSLDGLTSVADFDAVWNDASNREQFEELKRRTPDRARAMHAAGTGKRRALADKERQQAEHQQLGEL